MTKQQIADFFAKVKEDARRRRQLEKDLFELMFDAFMQGQYRDRW
jgi:hypothetical protein